MRTARDGIFGARSGRMIFSAMILMLAMSGWLWAQNGGSAAPPPPPAASTPGIDTSGNLPTFKEMFNTSPIINGLIAAMSVVSLTLFVGNLLTITTGRMLPGAFLGEVTKLVVARRFAEAAEFCRHNRHVFAASIVQRAAENADADHSTLLEIIEAEGRRRADLLWNRISYLLDVSSVAPMMGLLGTVLGMLHAFVLLPSTSASMNSKALAQAIGGAMTATFFGLIVAVASVVLYSIIKSRTIRALSDVESSVHSIVDHMKRGGR